MPPGQVIELIERVKEWYNAHGRPGERFGATLNRVGFERFEAEVWPRED